MTSKPPKEVSECPFCNGRDYTSDDTYLGLLEARKDHDAGHPSETNEADYLKEFVDRFGGKSFRKYIGGSWENEKQHRRDNVRAGIENKEPTIDDYEWYPGPNFNIPDVYKFFSSSIERARREERARIIKELDTIPVKEVTPTKWLHEETRKNLDMVYKCDVVHIVSNKEDL